MIKYNMETDKEALKDYVYRKSDETSANKLVIITGYTGPETIKWLEELDYDNIEVYVGMYGSRIRKSLDNVIKRVNDNDNISIFYTNSLVHSKIYMWFDNEILVEYAIGSANFSANALIENCYKETLECFENDLDCRDDLINYLNAIQLKGIDVKDYEVNDDVLSVDFLDEALNGELTLLATKGSNTENIIGEKTYVNDVHASACLNWGYSNALPILGDAYIPISTVFIKENPDLFGEKNPNGNIPIEVIWDDGEPMTLLLEGNNDTVVRGKIFPKQISSYKDKSILGDYLRRRIGKKIGKNLLFTDEEIQYVKEYKRKIGELKNAGIYNDSLKTIIRSNLAIYNSIVDKYVTKEMLEDYGCTKIKVKKISEGVYEFSFQ